MIQRPSAYLSPVQIDIDESYLNVPIIRQIELHTINNLPTKFRWTEVKHQILFSSKSNLRLSFHFSQNVSIKHNVQSKSIHAKVFSIKVNHATSKLPLYLNNADNWTMIGIFHVISKMHHSRYSWKSTRLWKEWMLNLNMMTSRKKNNCFLTYDRDLYFVVYLNWMIILHWILIKYH